MTPSQHSRSYSRVFTVLLLVNLYAAFQPISAQPQFEWAKGVQTLYSASPFASSSEGNEVFHSANGSLYHMGRSFFANDFDPGPAIDSQYIASGGGAGVRLNFLTRYYAATSGQSGQYSWTRCYPWATTTMPPDPEGLPIPTDSSVIYFAGFFTGTRDFNPGAVTANLTSTALGNGKDLFLARYDTAYNLIWAKDLAANHYATNGAVQRAISDKQGNIYIIGSFSSQMQFAGQSLWQGGAGEGFLVKVNPAGNIAWASHIDGVNGTTLQDIAVGADGGVIVCGYTGGGTLSGPLQFKGTAGTYNLPVLGPYTDAFIAKYSSTGAVLWARNVSGPSHQNGYDVAADSAGNVFLLGTMYEATTFDSSNIAGSTYQAPLFTAAYAPSGFLAKYSASGAYVWSKELAATNGFAPNDVVVDDSGQVFVGGSFQGAAAAAVSPIQYVSAGKTDGIVIKYRGSNGNYMWSTRYGSAEHDIVYGLGIGKSRELYVTGSVGVTTNFNPGGPSGMVTYIDYYPGAYRPRAFLVKYSNPIITAGGANLALNPLQIHPNPTTDAVTIEGAKAGTSYTVRSVLGPQVARGIVSSSQQTVSLEGLPPGIYIMMLSDKEGTRESARIIKR